MQPLDTNPLDTSRVGLILLAAGGSRRLGAPKQLVTDPEGRTLVRRAADAALGSACRPVAVVLGAAAEAAAAEIAGLPLLTAVNADWQTGLASSLRAGLDALTAAGDLDAAVVMLCDQPGVSPALLDSLLAAYAETRHAVVASEYGGVLGVPALFGAALFPALRLLTGDEGARRIIQNYPGPLTRLPFPEGIWDIDTPQDADTLRAS